MNNSQELQTYPVSACDIRWQYIGFPFLALWPLDSLEVTQKKLQSKLSYHIR